MVSVDVMSGEFQFGCTSSMPISSIVLFKSKYKLDILHPWYTQCAKSSVSSITCINKFIDSAIYTKLVAINTMHTNRGDISVVNEEEVTIPIIQIFDMKVKVL